MCVFCVNFSKLGVNEGFEGLKMCFFVLGMGEESNFAIKYFRNEELILKL